MEQLTVRQAKEQGYEHFGYSDEGYQAMIDIIDFGNSTPSGNERLFKKDPEPPFQVTADWVRDLLIDQLSDQWDSQTNDDTGEMEEYLKEIPVEKFEQLTSILNEAMANKHYYKLTAIKLIA